MAENVLLLDSINPAAFDVFKEAGLQTIEFEKSQSPEQLATSIADFDVRLLGVRSGPKIPASVIEAGQNLEAIGAFCVGTNHIDLNAANAEGVAVFNSVHENTRSVAEHVIASTFGLLRRIPEHNRNLHNGNWSKTDALSHEVRGKTIGIVGYGAIGSQVSVLAESIGMDVVYYDPAPQIPPHGRAQRLETMDELLGTADVVTLHVPGGERTRGMINATTIALMKKGSYLINTSRGEVVDYNAVAEAVESGQLGGVAADVFEDEPNKKGDPFDHILRDTDRAVLTPHIAGSTIEAQTDIGNKTAIKLLAYLATGNCLGSVNLPDLPLNGRQSGTSRLLNIHDNAPGVNATLNGLIAEAGLNITGSILRTRGDLGYIALDIEGDISQDLLSVIRSLRETRHTRVIQ